MKFNSTPNIAIIGLGYVGLPLAVAFSDHYKVIGYDIDSSRIESLNKFHDKTDEASSEALKKALNTNLSLSNQLYSIKNCSIYIVTVPTPVDEEKNPDLSYLLSASKTIGGVLKRGDIVIYESTVYPGCTEEDCVPVLEKESGLVLNQDFYCGYSPERINPGDKMNKVTTIKKVTSGSTPEVATYVDALYNQIIIAGTHLASSIKVAEASKAIENAQRDVNISFVNELALIFDKMGIDTQEVLDTAGTKWNFLNFKPGLVGGHCISVDPYYLAYKAKALGHTPQVILSGRNVNDHMAGFVANKLVKLLVAKNIPIKNAKCLILGVTFKENCPDISNSKIPSVYQELTEFGLDVSIYDSHANKDEVKKEFNLDLISSLEQYDAILVAVSHNEFYNLTLNDLKKSPESVVFDLKGVFLKEEVDARL